MRIGESSDAAVGVQVRPGTLADLTDDLLWPSLLRVPKLALRPDRWGLGFAAFVACWLIVHLPDLWTGRGEGAERFSAAFGRLMGGSVSGVADGVGSGSLSGAARALVGMFTEAPSSLFGQFPVSTVVAAVLLLVALPVFGGAISRACAVEFSRGQLRPWIESMSYALASARALVMAPVGLLLTILAIGLALAAGSWALLSVPVLNIVGAVLFGLALLVGVLLVLMLLGLGLGNPLMPAAVACDDADAIDSVQRSLAYCLGRPLRAALYWVILVVQSAVVLALAYAAIVATLALTGFVAAYFGGAGLKQIVAGDGLGLGWSDRTAAWIIGVWESLAVLLWGGLAVSLHYCGATVLYLLLRRLVDNQGVTDIWMPSASGLPDAAVPASDLESVEP